MERKSAGILGVCIVAAALIVALVPRGRSEPENGRYQVERGNENNVFVLDTKTGRLWRRFVASNSGPTDWTEDSAPWREPAVK